MFKIDLDQEKIKIEVKIHDIFLSKSIQKFVVFHRKSLRNKMSHHAQCPLLLFYQEQYLILP